MKITMRMIFCIMMLVWTVVGGFSHVYSMDQCGDSCSGASRSKECMCRSYTFAFVIIPPFTTANPVTGEAEGPVVEIVKKICETAEKLCIFSTVGFEDCWNSNGSDVLNGKWYDVCLPLIPIPPRISKFDYSEIPFVKMKNPGIYARSGSNITEEDLRKPNELYLAWMAASAFAIDVFLEAYFNDGYFIKNSNLFPIVESEPELGQQQLIKLIDNDCGGTTKLPVEYVILLPQENVLPEDNFTLIAELGLTPGVFSILLRKEEQCLLRWYEEAYKMIICSDDYPEFCQSLNILNDNVTDYCQNQEEICM